MFHVKQLNGGNVMIIIIGIIVCCIFSLGYAVGVIHASFSKGCDEYDNK